MQLLLGEMYYLGDGVTKNFKEAFYWFDLSAKQENEGALFYIGLMYANGDGVPQNYAKAMALYRAAAKRGNRSAQNNIGVLYAEGRGVPHSFTEAAKWYKLAAEGGDATAQCNLGSLYHNGNGVEKSIKRALEWYMLAAEQGDAQAQTLLGIMYHKGDGVQQDLSEAIKWFGRAAEQDDEEAQFYLGEIYYNNKDIPNNFTDAKKWYLLSAERGHAEAQCMLGQMHKRGEGVEQSFPEALKWYRKAAEQGHAVAQLNLGELYRKGKGVRQSDKEAIKWYKLSAAQGQPHAIDILEKKYPHEDYGQKKVVVPGLRPLDHDDLEEHPQPDDEYVQEKDDTPPILPKYEWKRNSILLYDAETIEHCRVAAEHGVIDAQYDLGGIYREGKGVPRNYPEAKKWYRLAAESGDADAQNVLGYMYEHGEGGVQSYSEAKRLYVMSANQGHADAHFNLGEMFRKGNGVPKDDKKAVRYYKPAARQGHADAIVIMEKKYPAEKYQIRSGTGDEKANKGIPVRVERIPTEKTNVPAVKFDDMTCLEAVKRTLAEKVILPLKYPAADDGSEKPKKGGIMFFGHPGTGKTMLAEGVAAELDAKFFCANCSHMESEWAEGSVQKIKDLFAEARKYEKAVIFFDEFDSIGWAINEENNDGKAVREILGQMQAAENASGMLLVIAATNAPWSLDEILLRPDIFVEKIYLPLPDRKARINILQKSLENCNFEPTVHMEYLAERLDEYSCADVKVFCERVNVLMSRKVFSMEKYPIITEDEMENLLYEARSSALVGEKKLMKEFLEASKQHRLSAWQ